MQVASWSGSPTGADAAFTILAVVRSQQPQDSAIAGWWDAYGGGVIWAGLKSSNGQTLPDFTRLFQLGIGQSYQGSQDLGTGRHALAYRYIPSTQKLTLAVDGVITSSSTLPPIFGLPAMPLILGAKSLLPTGVFRGDISELVIVPAAISDEEIQNFTEYARNTWQAISPPNTSGPCYDASGGFSPVGTRCDDGNPATYGDACAAGACSGTVPSPGSPAYLSAAAWYRASSADVAITDGGVSTWFDRTANHRDVFQAFYAGRPTLVATGWPGDKPTLHFNNAAIWRHEWSGSPAGAESAFSVLAVFRSGVTTHDAGVAGWWHGDGGGQTSCKLTHSSAMSLGMARRDGNGSNQTYAAATDVAADIHAAVWRYSAGQAKLTLDGVTVTAAAPAPLASLVFDSFLIGATSWLPTDLFTGDIPELAVVPRSITDTEMYAFEAYAHDEWGVPLACTPHCAGIACGADDGCGGTCECAPACDLNAPFDPPVPAFTGTKIANGLTFSQDGLTAYVSTKASSASNYSIKTATRASVSGSFGALTAIPSLNSGTDDRAPSLSRDGLNLYFTRLNSANHNSNDLAVATRASTSIAFGAPQFLTTLNTSLHDQDPFFLSGKNQLYFASESPSGVRDLYVSTLAGGSYSSPVGLSVNQGDAEDYRPVLSSDGLTLYFASSRPGIGGDREGDILMARRSALDQPFGPVTNLYGLNSSYAEFPVALADGDCTLYFASAEETGSTQNVRLYRATRAMSTPASVTTTLQIVGNGTVNSAPFACPPDCSATGAPDSTTVVWASSPARWSGSCTGNGGEPSTDGVVVFTNGGVCTVDFQVAGDGSLGSTCLTDADCTAGLTCDSGVCGGACCQDRHCGDDIPAACGSCSGICQNGDSGCRSDTECPAGSVCAMGVGDRYGLPTASSVCMPAACLAYDSRIPNCGVDDPACGECLPPPVSTTCGDAVRDPVSEQCDDGPGAQDDACSADCHVTDVAVAPLPPVDGERVGRSIDLGRHPVAVASLGSLLTYAESADSATALRGALFQYQGRPAALVDLGAGAFPSEYADASVAAVGLTRFAVAWNELGRGSLDVAMRTVTFGDPPELGNVVLANGVTSGAQQDPDLVWTGTELVVAWASEGSIVARRFDPTLAPLSAEVPLGAAGERAGSVALTRIESDWAAAWRVAAEDGVEVIRVHQGAMDWTVGPFLPGAADERPALIELDPSNLLVVFSVGTDPLVTGTPSLTRLRGAILSVGAPGATASFPLGTSNAQFSGDESVPESRPTLARVGTKLFLSWETGARTGDALSSEVWIQELTFDSSTGIGFGTELPIPLTAGRQSAQRAPALADSPLFPDGALAMAWEQHAEAWPYGARPDVVFALRPVPFVPLP